ncbi:MAG: fatty acid desaturase [Pseudomonadota bacterium]
MAERHRTAADIQKLVPSDDLKRLRQRSDRPGLMFLAGHILALSVTGWLVAILLESAWVLPAMFVHGVVIVHLFAPFHEATHGTAFRSRWLNRSVAWATGLALQLPPTHFTLEHAAHHKYTQDPIRDPERIPEAYSIKGYLWFATAISYFRGNFLNLFNHARGNFTEMERTFIPPNSFARVQREAWIIWSVYLGVTVLSIVFQSWAAVIYWLLPRVIGEPVMRIIRMSEHGACPLIPDMLRNTRTVVTLTPLRWLNWNNAHHAEHHAMPAIPFHALPKLHEHLGRHIDEVRPGYVDTQAHLLRSAARS